MRYTIGVQTEAASQTGEHVFEGPTGIPACDWYDADSATSAVEGWVTADLEQRPDVTRAPINGEFFLFSAQSTEDETDRALVEVRLNGPTPEFTLHTQESHDALYGDGPIAGDDALPADFVQQLGEALGISQDVIDEVLVAEDSSR